MSEINNQENTVYMFRCWLLATTKITFLICSILVGFAPFSSLSKRQSFLTISNQMTETPGPGHYQLDCTHLNNLKGGESLQRKVIAMDGYFCEKHPVESVIYL